jgi:glutamyl-tRNA reductase
VSILLVGMSHRSAPVRVLEQAAIPADRVPGVLARAAATAHVGEAVILSTCNRVEVYAVVDRFHGGVDDLTALLAEESGLPLEDLTPHLYVHYDEGAVQHLFSVVCGLDSMVVGEAQVLGQTKTALRLAQQTGSAGTLLNELFQNALRVGKRAHSETDIDRAGSALVTVGLERAAAALGGLEGREILIIGAGSMGGIVAAALSGQHLAGVTVANRTEAHGGRLAASLGGRVVGLPELDAALVRADLVVSCTGATGHIVDLAAATAAQDRRGGRAWSFLDLALPRDVEPLVAGLDGVSVISLDDLGALLADAEHLADVEAVRALAAEELTAYAVAQRAARVAPTVVALRQLAADVVAAELARLDVRLPDLDSAARAEVELTVRRTVDKLLHAPTVRMKELAADEGGQAYAEALHRLFDLDPEAIDLVARATAPEGSTS